MTTVDPTATDASSASSDRRPRWPWIGVAAGVLGTCATLLADIRSGVQETNGVDARVLDEVSRGMAHFGLVTGFACVSLLLVLAASWRRRVEPRMAGSIAAAVIAPALTASAAGLTYGYAWKGAMAIYLPQGLDEKSFTTDGLFVYFMLNDFGGFIGWLGVVVAAGAMVWLSLRERVVSRWIGWFSLLPVLAVTAFAGVTGLPGFQGVVGPVWLVIAFLGLALGRSTLTR